MLGYGIMEASESAVCARGPRIRQEETQIAGSRTTMGDGVDASPEGRSVCFAAASRELEGVRSMADGVRDGRRLDTGLLAREAGSQVSDRVRAGWERW